MRITEVKERTPLLIEQLLKVWEDSVKKTHLFLSADEISNIKRYVPEALKNISHLIIAEDENNCPVAFMGLENQVLEMLFLSPEERGKGLGKKLIQYGIENYSINELAVNEQNLFLFPPVFRSPRGRPDKIRIPGLRRRTGAGFRDRR